MVKIYICEDNPIHLKGIARHVNYYCSFSTWDMKIAAATRSPEELLNQLDVDSEVNIYLLDLEYSLVSRMNGFELGKKIRAVDPLGYIIYVTSHVEMSYLTFQYRVNAIDFIIKDGPEDLAQRITNCLKTIEERLDTLKKRELKKVLKLDTSYGLSSFFIEEIIAFEAAAAHKIYLYTEERKMTIFKKTLNDLEEMFPNDLVRCHRSFLINESKIESIEKNVSEIVMVNKMVIPVSTRKKKSIRKKVHS